MDPESFAAVQKALAEPKRVEILEQIRQCNAPDGIACSAVLEKVDVAQATFSHHVSELVKADLINARKDGRYMKLTLNEPVVEAYLNELRKKFLG